MKPVSRSLEESVVFPLVEVRVMQVSYCLFKISLRASGDMPVNKHYHETENANTQGDKRVAARKVGSDFTDFRLYTVAKGENILVTIRNLSRTRDISFRTVYVDEKGVETDVVEKGVETDIETLFKIKSGVEFKMPELVLGSVEEENAWSINDNQEETLLELHFVTIQKWNKRVSH